MEYFFQDKYELGIHEIKNDFVFKKIPPEQYNELIDFAWDIGEKTAHEYIYKYKTNVPSQILKELNITLIDANRGVVLPEYKVLSEYCSNLKKIILYKDVIMEEFDSLYKKGVTQLNEYDRIRELFIAHEIFHHIECHEIGLISKRKKVDTLKIGPIRLTSGIKSLSEIGAHSFTKSLLISLV